MESKTPDVGERLTDLIERLFPICRSITGEGVRQTLSILSEYIDLDIHEVPSGSRVLDWTVPQEWSIEDAYVARSDGTRVIDFRESNLHVVSYSVPVRARMSRAELLNHLHSLPDQPDLIPYRTSYYQESWGFCAAHDVVTALPEDDYEVVIDSRLRPGSLTYGEFVVPGESDDEVIVSTHTCHPSLCDDNLSGISIATLVAERLAAGPTPRRTFRFVFAPGTIGTIAWLDRNRYRASRLTAGLTLSCLGDHHHLTFKRTERADTVTDRAAQHVLEWSELDHEVVDFFPYGYDERQYNSPGFRIPVGSLMRGRHGQFPEYHTSADNLSFISADRLSESLHIVNRILRVLDRNRTMTNLEPYGEPQLGSRGLYGALGGVTVPDAQLAMLWVLNQSDGTADLLKIADRANLPFDSIEATATILEEHGLLREVRAGGS